MKINYNRSAEWLKQIYGENPDKIIFYTLNRSVARSNMSAEISAYVIKDNEPLHIATGRVHGCGLDRGFELAYNIFCTAYPKIRYQEHLEHHWL